LDTQVFITQYNINNNYCPESSQEPMQEAAETTHTAIESQHSTVGRQRQGKVEELHN